MLKPVDGRVYEPIGRAQSFAFFDDGRYQEKIWFHVSGCMVDSIMYFWATYLSSVHNSRARLWWGYSICGHRLPQFPTRAGSAILPAFQSPPVETIPRADSLRLCRHAEHRFGKSHPSARYRAASLSVMVYALPSSSQMLSPIIPFLCSSILGGGYPPRRLVVEVGVEASEL